MGNSHSLEGKIIDEKKWLKYPLARLYDYKSLRSDYSDLSLDEKPLESGIVDLVLTKYQKRLQDDILDHKEVLRSIEMLHSAWNGQAEKIRKSKSRFFYRKANQEMDIFDAKDAFQLQHRNSCEARDQIMSDIKLLLSSVHKIDLGRARYDNENSLRGVIMKVICFVVTRSKTEASQHSTTSSSDKVWSIFDCSDNAVFQLFSSQESDYVETLLATNISLCVGVCQLHLKNSQSLEDIRLLLEPVFDMLSSVINGMPKQVALKNNNQDLSIEVEEVVSKFLSSSKMDVRQPLSSCIPVSTMHFSLSLIVGNVKNIDNSLSIGISKNLLASSEIVGKSPNSFGTMIDSNGTSFFSNGSILARSSAKLQSGMLVSLVVNKFEGWMTFAINSSIFNTIQLPSQSKDFSLVLTAKGIFDLQILPLSYLVLKDYISQNESFLNRTVMRPKACKKNHQLDVMIRQLPPNACSDVCISCDVCDCSCIENDFLPYYHCTPCNYDCCSRCFLDNVAEPMKMKKDSQLVTIESLHPLRRCSRGTVLWNATNKLTSLLRRSLSECEKFSLQDSGESWNQTLCSMLSLAIIRSSLKGLLEVIDILLVSNRTIQDDPSIRNNLSYFFSKSKFDSNNFSFFAASSSIEQCIILLQGVYLASSYGFGYNLSFPIESKADFEYLWTLSSRGIESLEDDTYCLHKVRLGGFALGIIYHNVSIATSHLSRNEKLKFLEVTTVQGNIRDEMIESLGKVVSNSHVDPHEQEIGLYSVKFLSLRDIFFTSPSIQFTRLCELTRKEENNLITLCEKALLNAWMSDLQGNNLLDLLSNSSENCESEEGKEEMNFLISLLDLLSRNVATRCNQILSGNIDIVEENSIVNINKITEGLVIKLLSTMITNALNRIDSLKVSSKKDVLLPIESFMRELSRSCTEVIHKIAGFYAKVSEMLENNTSRDSALRILNEIENQIERSFLSSLIPLTLTAVGIFVQASGYDEFISDFLCNIIQDFSENLSFMKKISFFRINLTEKVPPVTLMESASFVLPPHQNISSWNREFSSRSLDISEDSTVCRRPGSVSCFPAAFAIIDEDIAIFNVTLSATGSVTNWQTIGLCAANFPVSNSDGFGRNTGSWGIADDRSKPEPAQFICSGFSTKAPRKLQVGDNITLICNLAEQCLEITVNFGEFTHIFGKKPECILSETIAHLMGTKIIGEASNSGVGPSGKPTDFWFGSTFANDHALTIKKLSSVLDNANLDDSNCSPVSFCDRYILETESLCMHHLICQRSLINMMSRKKINWLSTPIFRHGKAFPKSGRPLLFSQLTDAPNGVGDGNILVERMKKLVPQDRGKESQSNHLVHAVCAAMLWHLGLYEEADQLVSDSGVQPSREFLNAWKYAQDFRLSPLASIQESSREDQTKLITRSHSIPVSEEPLSAVIIEAISRARFLLEFSPCGHIDEDELISSEGVEVAPTAKPASILDWIFHFVETGPSTDEMRQELKMRNAKLRKMIDFIRASTSYIKETKNLESIYRALDNVLLSLRNSSDSNGPVSLEMEYGGCDASELSSLRNSFINLFYLLFDNISRSLEGLKFSESCTEILSFIAMTFDLLISISWAPCDVSFFVKANIVDLLTGLYGSNVYYLRRLSLKYVEWLYLLCRDMPKNEMAESIISAISSFFALWLSDEERNHSVSSIVKSIDANACQVQGMIVCNRLEAASLLKFDLSYQAIVSFSFSLWVWFDTESDHGVIFSIGNPLATCKDSRYFLSPWSHICLRLLPNLRLQLEIFDDNEVSTDGQDSLRVRLTSKTSIFLQKWCHVGFTVNEIDSSVCLFCDGYCVATYKLNSLMVQLMKRSFIPNQGAWFGQRRHPLKYATEKLFIDFMSARCLVSNFMVSNSATYIYPGVTSFNDIVEESQEGVCLTNLSDIEKTYFVSLPLVKHWAMTSSFKIISLKSRVFVGVFYDFCLPLAHIANEEDDIHKIPGVFGILIYPNEVYSISWGEMSLLPILVSVGDVVSGSVDVKGGITFTIASDNGGAVNLFSETVEVSTFGRSRFGFRLGKSDTLLLSKSIAEPCIRSDILTSSFDHNSVVGDVVRSWDGPIRFNNCQVEVSPEGISVTNSSTRAVFSATECTVTASIKSPRSCITVMVLNISMSDLFSLGVFRGSYLHSTNVDSIDQPPIPVENNMIRSNNGFGQFPLSWGVTSNHIEAIVQDGYSNRSTREPIADMDVVCLLVDFTVCPALMQVRISGELVSSFEIATQHPNEFQDFFFAITVPQESNIVIIPDETVLNTLPPPRPFVSNTSTSEVCESMSCFKVDCGFELAPPSRSWTTSDLLRCMGFVSRSLFCHKNMIEQFSLFWKLSFSACSSTLRSLSMDIVCKLIHVMECSTMIAKIKGEISVPLDYENPSVFLRSVFRVIGWAIMDPSSVNGSVHIGLDISFKVFLRFAKELLRSLCWKDELSTAIGNILMIGKASIHKLSSYHNSIHRDIIEGKELIRDRRLNFSKEDAEIFGVLALFSRKLFSDDFHLGATVRCHHTIEGLDSLCTIIGESSMAYSSFRNYGETMVVVNPFESSLTSRDFVVPKTLIDSFQDQKIMGDLFIFHFPFFLDIIDICLSIETSDIRPLSDSSGPNTRFDTYSLAYESLHPYADNSDIFFRISIPGAKELSISFDPRSKTEPDYDYVCFYRDESKSSVWGNEKYSGSIWPGVNDCPPLIIDSDTIFFCFRSDGSNHDWGYKFTVTGNILSSSLKPRNANRAVICSRMIKLLGTDILNNLLNYANSQDTIKSQIFSLMSSKWMNILKTIVAQNSLCVLPYIGESNSDQLGIDLARVPVINLNETIYLLEEMGHLNNVHSDEIDNVSSFVDTKARDLEVLGTELIYGHVSKSLSSSKNTDVQISSLSANSFCSNIALMKKLSHGDHEQVLPRDSCNINDLLKGVIDSDVESSIVDKVDVFSVRLVCSGSTPGCKIRSKPSLSSLPRGLVYHSSIIEVIARVDDFFVLNDAEGYCCANYDGISWQVNEIFPKKSLDMINSTTISHLDPQKKIESVFDYHIGESLVALSNEVLSQLFFMWPSSIPFSFERSDLDILLRVCGLGKSKSSRMAGSKTSSLLAEAIKVFFAKMIDKSVVSSFEDTEKILLSLMIQNSSVENKRQEQSSELFLKPIVLESDHDYVNNSNTIQRIYLPGCNGMEIFFDENSSTEKHYDKVTIYADARKTKVLGGPYSGRKGKKHNWPGVGSNSSLMLKNVDSCFVNFVSDDSNVDWGWRLTAFPLGNNEETSTDSFDLLLDANYIKIRSRSPIPLVEAFRTVKPSFWLSISLLEMLMSHNLNTTNLFANEDGIRLFQSLVSNVYLIVTSSEEESINIINILGNVLAFSHSFLLSNRSISADIRKAISCLCHRINDLSPEVFNKFSTITSPGHLLRSFAYLFVAVHRLSSFIFSQESCNRSTNFSKSDLFMDSSLTLCYEGYGVRAASNCEHKTIALGPSFDGLFVFSSKCIDSYSNYFSIGDFHSGESLEIGISLLPVNYFDTHIFDDVKNNILCNGYFVQLQDFSPKNVHMASEKIVDARSGDIFGISLSVLKRGLSDISLTISRNSVFISTTTIVLSTVGFDEIEYPDLLPVLCVRFHPLSVCKVHFLKENEVPLISNRVPTTFSVVTQSFELPVEKSSRSRIFLSRDSEDSSDSEQSRNSTSSSEDNDTMEMISHNNIAFMKTWDRDCSNPSIVFSDGYRTATWSDQHSFNPTAFINIKISDVYQGVEFRVLKVPSIGEVFSVGVSANQYLGGSTDCCLGQREDSWGMFCTKTSRKQMQIGHCGSIVGSCRGLEEGDVIDIIIGKSSNTCIYLWLNGALIQKFDIRNELKFDSLLVGASFCENFSLSLLSSSKPEFDTPVSIPRSLMKARELFYFIDHNLMLSQNETLSHYFYLIYDNKKFKLSKSSGNAAVNPLVEAVDNVSTFSKLLLNYETNSILPCDGVLSLLMPNIISDLLPKSLNNLKTIYDSTDKILAKTANAIGYIIIVLGKPDISSVLCDFKFKKSKFSDDSINFNGCLAVDSTISLESLDIDYYRYILREIEPQLFSAAKGGCSFEAQCFSCEGFEGQFEIGDYVACCRNIVISREIVIYPGEVGVVIDVGDVVVTVLWRMGVTSTSPFEELKLYFRQRAPKGSIFSPSSFFLSPIGYDEVEIYFSNKLSTGIKVIVSPLIDPGAVLVEPAFEDLRRDVTLKYHNILMSRPVKLSNNYVDSTSIQHYLHEIDMTLVKFVDDVVNEKEWNAQDVLKKKWEDLVASSSATVVKNQILLLVCKRELGFDVSANNYVDISKSPLLLTHYHLLRELNFNLNSCLEYFDLNITESPNKEVTPVASIERAAYRARGLIFNCIKSNLIRSMLSQSEVKDQKFDLVISRSRPLKYRQRNLVDTEGVWSVFGQAFRRINSLKPSILRRSNQIWDAVLAGEKAQDAGGPYRESWSAIIEDLQSVYLPLLCVSPNTANSPDKSYVVNPQCQHSSIQLEMLVFVGKLMGISIRSKQYLDLALCSLVWKLIAHEEIGVNDIGSIDSVARSIIWQLRSKAETLSEEDFLNNFSHLCFSWTSLTGGMYDLVPNGSHIPVTPENCASFCDLLEKFRLSEMKIVCEAIRRGIESVVPPIVLNLLSWYQLEEMVCGKPIIDINLLRSVTEYTACSPRDEHIQWFWDILSQDFSNDDRRAFIRFAWGRSRLPLNRSSFSHAFKIQNLSKMPGDSYLPESHTCFFTVDIPRYSSKEVLREKLLYAIRNCSAIDADACGNNLAWED